MADSLQIRVYDPVQEVYVGLVSGNVELGRQGDSGERLYSKTRLEREGRWRLVVAGRDEDSVSRRHALVEPIGPGRVRVVNLSAKVAIRLQDGPDLGPSAVREIALPVVLTLGRKVVRVLEAPPEEIQFQGLPAASAPGSQAMVTPSAFASMSMSMPAGGEVEIEEVVRWLRDAMGVLQSAASSSDFYDKAARAVVENVGLDTGRVVLRDGEDWKTAAAWSASGVALDVHHVPSRVVLSRVLHERRTLWHEPNASRPKEIDSLLDVSAVVAAPILNEENEVIGAIYGDRRRYEGPGQPPRITKLDALFVDVLAASVAAGLARLASQREADAARAQFAQFFTPELADQIAARPELLDGQESEITLLFADIRGFSRFSERLGPARTVSWIYEVMGLLSDCVLAHRGILVDYIGDELMAMWGAPEPQPDQARLACLAALDMIRLLPEMNARFLQDIGEAMDLGIGINTGVARVGNTGSRHKFKYGPLGNTVNLASRVQGVTKYLKVRLLVTEATQARLGPDFSSRRIGKVRVLNISEPVNLYELVPSGGPAWESWKATRLDYESALAEFERKGLYMATRILGGLLNEHPEDGPSKVLLSRVVNGLVDPETFDPVFVVPGK